MSKTSIWAASLRNDLVSYGTGGEDPGDVLGEVEYVIVEAPDGRRFAHDRSFDITVKATSDDGFVHARRNPSGKVAADRFLAKVTAAIAAGRWVGPVDNPHWAEVSPCYGSEAYQANQPRWEFDAMDEDERAAYLRRHGDYPSGY